MFILGQNQEKIKRNGKKRGMFMAKKKLPEACNTEEKIQEERKEDYKLQDTIQRLLQSNGYKNEVTACLKKPVGTPYLARSKKSERVSYGNISTCSNVYLLKKNRKEKSTGNC